jgi:hypothetical protein
MSSKDASCRSFVGMDFYTLSARRKLSARNYFVNSLFVDVNMHKKSQQLLAFET